MYSPGSQRAHALHALPVKSPLAWYRPSAHASHCTSAEPLHAVDANSPALQLPQAKHCGGVVSSGTHVEIPDSGWNSPGGHWEQRPSTAPVQVEVAGTYSPASQVAQAAQLVAVASAAGCTRPAAHVSHAATTTQEVARLSDIETETVLGLAPMYRR